uniref:Carbohydrate kinase FGGY N-terminal domain-containing protein n=1 Tax=Wuchereria bancrofti TaxID=6293 RepID=A0A1I8EX96_WUCBA
MEKSVTHNAWLKHESKMYREQDPVKILNVLHNLIKSMEIKLSLNVTVIPKEFLNSLPRWDYGYLHIGFGMVTLAWLHSSNQLNTEWTCCGTIMDLIICYLSQSSKAFIGIQNAYSWGYCSYNGHWTVSDELVPVHILPTIYSTEEIVGLVKRANFGLPIGAKLLASCGDLQSTVYPLLESGTAVLNLGTSAQLCFLPTINLIASAPLLTIPFFGKRGKNKIIVAASMNGGNAINLIAEVDYRKLNDILNESKNCSSSTIDIQPVFIPERIDNVSSYISGINSSTTIEEILHRTACGIVSNLFRLLSPYQLREWGIERIKLAGNANKNYFIDEIIQQCEGLLEIITSSNACPKCSAAYGAALHALHFTNAK